MENIVRLDTAKHVIFYRESEKSEMFLNFLKSPENFMKNGDARVLKVGSRTVVRTLLNQKAIVVKRYNVKRVSHFFRRCLIPTRAMRAWQMAARLINLNIPIATPVAMIENRHFSLLRGRSYYITDYIDGEHIGDFFHKTNLSDPAFLAIASQLITILEKLAKLKITHGDLKMTNMLVQDGKLFFIDLDGMKQYKTSFQFWKSFNKEQKRFLKNWEMLPEIESYFKRLFNDMNQRLLAQ